MTFTRQEPKDEIREIDLSYKDNALRVTYDVESTPNLFTLAMIHDKALSLIFFGDDQFNDLSNDELYYQMEKFATKESTKRYLESAKNGNIDLHLYRYSSNNPESIEDFGDTLLRIITNKPLKYDEQYGYEFVEYCGWNSFRYDLPVLVLIREYLIKDPSITPQDIRKLSNILINFNDRDWKLPEHVEASTNGKVKASNFKTTKNLALYSDGHIDWAKLAKSNETEGTERVIPPGLKKEMARFGMDIIIDESVSDDEEKIWSSAERDDLVDYNFNDVLGTKVIGASSALEGELRTRDMIREMFPYTAAHYTDMSNISKYAPPERDITGPSLAALVLIGPKRIKPEDWGSVQYLFPVPDPDNKGKFKNVDLWNYMKTKEKFIHPYLDDFFSHFRNKDTTTRFDDMKVKESQPITHHSAMNMPYYQGNGKPSDSFARVSTGGAHGSVMAGLHKMSEEEVKAWIKSDPKLDLDDKPTIDTLSCIHLDWASFYPTMASKMQIYRTTEGIDRYTGIKEKRLIIKEEASRLWHEGKKDTPEYVKTQEDQIGLKFIMNGATGAGNMHQKYALLPVDNKTLSMRLIGNMLIWCLGQRLTAAGAYVISTNTDGLYTTGLSMEEIQKVVDEYVKDYGMDVEPESLKRFINRDTSNRCEFDFNEHQIDKVGGTLRHGLGLDFNPRSMGSNVAYPLIAANATLYYMAQDVNWYKKPYDASILRGYIESIAKGEPKHSAWFHTFVGTKARRFTIDGIPQQKINRVLLTTDGQQIGNEKNARLKKDEYFMMWNQLKSNTINDLSDIILTESTKQLIEMHESNIPELKNYFENSDNILDKIDFIFEEALTDKNFTDLEFKFVEKRKIENVEVWQTIDCPDRMLSYEEFSELAKNNNMKVLGYKLKSDTLWEPVKAWKRSALTNYPSNIGTVVNTAEELENFDYSKLDIDAYLKWAEDLLSKWKVTADIPEIGLKSYNDEVIPSEKKIRVTKKDKEIETLKEFYNSALENLSLN